MIASLVAPCQAASEQAPPTCNTGVLFTSVEGEHPALSVDWLEYTLPSEALPPQHAVPGIEPAEWVPMNRGGMGYRYSFRRGHCAIYCNEAPLVDPEYDMGVHVQMSGKGCREMEQAGIMAWGALVEWVWQHGGHLTRVDIALDERQGLLDMAVIQAKLEAGEYRSAAKFWMSETSGRKRAEVAGRTIYLGRPSSDTRLRIYDKAAEQNVTGPWVRVELQLRRERADQAFKRYLQYGESQWLGLMRRQLDFVEPSTTDTNVSRWAVSAWWLTLMENAQHVKLSIGKAVQTVEAIARWLYRQVAPSLALLVEVRGQSTDVAYELWENGKARWNPVQRALLACEAPA